ncbi:MAG TPA: hypothetical protein VLF94_02610 [Chlamydiales bacterium]|nr:hypothetical protein [Chlamydiales bacterium]
MTAATALLNRVRHLVQHPPENDDVINNLAEEARALASPATRGTVDQIYQEIARVRQAMENRRGVALLPVRAVPLQRPAPAPERPPLAAQPPQVADVQAQAQALLQAFQQMAPEARAQLLAPAAAQQAPGNPLGVPPQLLALIGPALPGLLAAAGPALGRALAGPGFAAPAAQPQVAPVANPAPAPAQRVEAENPQPALAPPEDVLAQMPRLMAALPQVNRDELLQIVRELPANLSAQCFRFLVAVEALLQAPAAAPAQPVDDNEPAPSCTVILQRIANIFRDCMRIVVNFLRPFLCCLAHAREPVRQPPADPVPPQQQRAPAA